MHFLGGVHTVYEVVTILVKSLVVDSYLRQARYPRFIGEKGYHEIENMVVETMYVVLVFRAEDRREKQY